jgi:dual specificity MAP kinase phosphatase
MNKSSESSATRNVELEAPLLAELIQTKLPTEGRLPSELLVVDCRRFLDYNTSHIRSAVNICCSKLVRRRLQENKMSALDLLLQQLSACGLGTIKDRPCPDNLHVILYDQQNFPDPSPQLSKAASIGSEPVPKEKKPLGNLAPSSTLKKVAGTGVCVLKLKAKSGSFPAGPQRGRLSAMDDSTFVNILIDKLSSCTQLASVKILKGGFLDFQARYPELCEGAAPIGGIPATPGRGASARLSLTSLSQPCMPVSNQGPTRILPFLYLGSQQDALDCELLKKHSIDYVLNLSISCPRPEFLGEESFLRIPVNDSYTEKLLPYFEEAFEFLDKVREGNGSVLVHCLAGISRSPTLAIAYIMRHLHMTSEEAYRYIKEKRPSISPNFNFLGQLLEYEKLLKARRGQEVQEQLKGSLRKVLVPPTLSPRPATARQASEQATKEAPALTRTNSFPLDYPGMKRSFSCPVKIQKLGRTSEPQKSDPESVPMEVDEQSPSSVKNYNGKREMRPSRENETASSDAVPPKVIEINDRPIPQVLPFPKISSDWQDSDPATIQPAVPRPRGLIGLRTRCALNIPQPVQEDLPSPSTELSNTLVGFKMAETPDKERKEFKPEEVSKRKEGDDEIFFETMETVDLNRDDFLSAVESSPFRFPKLRAVDTTSANPALNPEKVQIEEELEGAAARKSRPPSLEFFPCLDTFSASPNAAGPQASRKIRPTDMCAANPFFAAMAACGGVVPSQPSISPEFETPPTEFPGVDFETPPMSRAAEVGTLRFLPLSSTISSTGCESTTEHSTGKEEPSAEKETKRDSGFDQTAHQDTSVPTVFITQPTPPVVTMQPTLTRMPSETPLLDAKSTATICAAENPLFPSSASPRRKLPSASGKLSIFGSGRKNSSGEKLEKTQQRSSSLEKATAGKSEKQQKIIQKIGNLFRKAPHAPPIFAPSAATAAGPSFPAGGPNPQIFSSYFLENVAVAATASGSSAGSQRFGIGTLGVAKSATSGGISSSDLQSSSPPPKSKSETALLCSMADLDSPESGFVESYTARDPETVSVGSESSLEITVH